MKNKYNFWSNQNPSGSKPKKWNFIEPLIYSSEVIVYDNDIKKLQSEKIGTIILKYKLNNDSRYLLDDDYLKDYLFEKFDRYVIYNQSTFKRDGGQIAFLKSIYLTKEELSKFLRTEKLKRICEE